MPSKTDNYWSATKHPWACVLFVLPMVAVYEVGLYALNRASPESIRNGADVWLRTGLASIGVSPLYGAPCLLLVILLAWGLLRRDDRPLDKVGVWVGMVGESAAFAVLLVGLSQGFWLMLLRADLVLGQPGQRIAVLQMATEPETLWGHIISYLGAGIYEETLFRLLLFAGFLRLFSWGDGPRSPWGVALAAFASALLFAGAHHLGPSGEAFNSYVLAFRTFAGLYFAGLYHTRGFGIAVGAHAGYDVIVGLVLQR